jgi:hypothetical protein
MAIAVLIVKNNLRHRTKLRRKNLVLNKADRSKEFVEILSFIRAQRRREPSADRVGSA